MSHRSRVCRGLELSRDLLGAAFANQTILNAAARAAVIITDAELAGRKLLLAGNGGSRA